MANKIKIEVFSPCEELKPTLKRFIENVFAGGKTEVSELYVIDESPEEENKTHIKNFWNQITKLNSIHPILFITFSSSETHGALEFLKSITERWEVWNPTGKIPLKLVLKYLLNIEGIRNE